MTALDHLDQHEGHHPHEERPDGAVLRMTGVTKTHGDGTERVVALDAVDLTIHPGELVAVMGPSGSGKSTLLNLAGTLDRPDSGSIRIDGVEVTGLKPDTLATLRRRSIGIVFQDLNLLPALTLAENVALPMELDGVRPAVAREHALRALADVGLEGLGERFGEQVSGGQRQRAAIARALVGDRRLILADEPTGALDSHTGDEVMALVRQRCDEGAVGLLVTHDARHAAWADRTVSLLDGREVSQTGAGVVYR